MATAKQRRERIERERARTYESRVRFEQSRVARRRRDNVLACLVAGVVVLLAVGGQTMFYTVGPGAADEAVVTPSPEPIETPASEPATTPEPTATPDDAE